ncbi:MAG: hypothetical protein A2033_04120 [Bacteroidetes bacterium GWA2_31_9]|nr:MAG: hypothetical protein A2033_04120 [Bacteroidetes bacterium GWA2_31_9]
MNLTTFNKEYELLFEKNPFIACELNTVYPDKFRFIYTYDEKDNYILKDGTELLSIEGGEKNDYSDFNNIIFWDAVNYRIRTMSLNPDEIIKRIRINKEFGEVYKLTEKEKEKLGVTKP